MIPKIIHYVWVGDSPKGELVESCIASWRKWLPDYEVMEWGNEQLSFIDNAYVKEAFDARRWAFVSDYLRLYALYEYGGFYFDSDLEVTADLDRFREHDFVSGFEVFRGNASPITALMGAAPKNSFVKSLLDDYDERVFVFPDGSYDLTPNTQVISEAIAREFGVSAPYDSNNELPLSRGAIIYPSCFFCTPVEGKDNYSIHHFSGSWLDGYSRKEYVSIFGFSLVRFKLRRNKSSVLPVMGGERVLMRLPVAKKYIFTILKK